jgi:hypothetical protein
MVIICVHHNIFLRTHSPRNYDEQTKFFELQRYFINNLKLLCALNILVVLSALDTKLAVFVALQFSRSLLISLSCYSVLNRFDFRTICGPVAPPAND